MLRRAAIGLPLMFGGLGGAIYALQDRLIYFPDPTPPPPPALLGLSGVDVVELRTADGLALLGWSMAPTREGAPTILYLHGNGGSLAHRAPRVQRFRQHGFGALFVEWRGYGGNAGTPGEDGFTRDAEAGLAFLRAHGVPASRTVLWGESLGTGIAVRIAAERPEEVAAVVLESPYTSLLDLAHRHYPILPARLLLRDRFDNLSRVPQVTAPVLILQGSVDTLVPPEMGRRLAAAGRRVEVWEAPGAGHNELGPAGGVEKAAEFLRRLTNAP
jgi:pimeloyl-ACP methyl ester carboxylesterase